MLGKEMGIHFEGYQCLNCRKKRKSTGKVIVMIVFMPVRRLEIGS
jgi:hypothetical protein